MLLRLRLATNAAIEVRAAKEIIIIIIITAVVSG